ncbi:hypothetical protein VKT23_016210 [Stygiomarasmius scandens]|uniref:Uncharacterized protein n=1 Tax=Marasmiellus scandens TaxID=2682957 RepID=A0ABR1IYD9_9AGAR
MRDIETFEAKLQIEKTWEEGCEEWKAMAHRVKLTKYQNALDKLEGHLIASIFELGKTHLVGTGVRDQMVARMLQQTTFIFKLPGFDSSNKQYFQVGVPMHNQDWVLSTPEQLAAYHIRVEVIELNWEDDEEDEDDGWDDEEDARQAEEVMAVMEDK